MRTLSTRGRAARLVGAGALCLAVAGATASTASGTGVKSRAVVKSFKSVTMGTFLTTTAGRPLYTLSTDRKDHSTCNGSCLATWPALTVPKRVRPTGTTGLGTFRRSNGKIQVTWRGRPLYTFVSDSPDQPTGNGVAGFKLAVTKAAHASGSVTTTTSAGGGW
jgi:predicted lipoprotein with Yx(FWY)xxD motif